MQEYFEKIKERLEESQHIEFYFDGRPPKQSIDFVDAIEIVNQVAEEYKQQNNICKQAAIEILKAEKECVIRNINNQCNRDCSKCDLLKEDTDILKAYDTAISMLENQNMSEKPTGSDDGWIPCSERLPKFEIYTVKRMWVTMQRKGGDFRISRQLIWNGCMGKWEWENGKAISDKYEIVAWKPLDIPVPYQPKGEK